MRRWSGKGESIFLRLPRVGSILYDRLMCGSPMRRYYEEIAQDLSGRIPGRRLLDLGTGPGRLLQAIHALNPSLDLHGLDISASMISQARKNLAGMAVDLRQGNAQKTGFPVDFFDAVICSGSFYLWEKPEEGLEEIHRILKPGKAAFLYECDRESDRQAVHLALEKNLRQVNLPSRIFGPMAIRQALDAAYSRDEMEAIIRRTSFRRSYSIEKMTLSGLPMWLRMELRKAG